MAMENHYDALVEKHRRIESKLSAEMRRPAPDPFTLQRLKRQKLMVRDEIESWERLLSAVRVRPVFQTGSLHA